MERTHILETSSATSKMSNSTNRPGMDAAAVMLPRPVRALPATATVLRNTAAGNCAEKRVHPWPRWLVDSQSTHGPGAWRAVPGYCARARATPACSGDLVSEHGGDRLIEEMPVGPAHHRVSL